MNKQVQISSDQSSYMCNIYTAKGLLIKLVTWCTNHSHVQRVNILIISGLGLAMVISLALVYLALFPAIPASSGNEAIYVHQYGLCAYWENVCS